MVNRFLKEFIFEVYFVRKLGDSVLYDQLEFMLKILSFLSSQICNSPYLFQKHVGVLDFILETCHFLEFAGDQGVVVYFVGLDLLLEISGLRILEIKGF